ncbi:transglutaminase domain protein [Lachnospiraceae bacterium TWA4]|nr:transglutaminase domain protein [Lachnospiraceae bacterium TWA4]
MKKRVLGLLLCAVMVLAMLAGCSNSGDSKTTTAAKEETKATETTAAKETQAAATEAKKQSGVVTNDIDMTKYEKGKVVRVWLPIPQDNDYQKITDVKYDAGDAKAEEATDDQGNKMLYIEWGKDADPASRKATLSFHAERTEVVRPELKEEGTVGSDMDEYLKGSAMVKVDDPEVQKLAKEITDGKDAVVDKARAIYDWIYDNMNRDNSVTGCGDGDICRLLAEGVRAGKCTDINSVFVGLCRASGIPAREMFGIRINADDITKNQHCWAEFYVPGTGWVGADPADVLKFVLNADGEPYDKASAEALEKKEYYWGNTDEKRVELTHGRDLTLSPAQAGEALNDFGYPYAEVDDEVIDYYTPDAFVYTYSFAEDK